jgi:ribose transport system permease protein
MFGRESFSVRWLLQRFGPLVALVLLAAGTAAYEYASRGSSSFLTPLNLANVLRQNATLGIVAIGMTFVIILGGIDLSVGALLALAGGVGVWLMGTMMDAAGVVQAAQFDLESGFEVKQTFTLWFAQRLVDWNLAGNFPAAVAAGILLMLLIGLLAGLLNGLLVTRGRLAPFIATLGTMVIFRSMGMAFAEGGEVRVPHSAQGFDRLGGGGVPLPLVYTAGRGAEGEVVHQSVYLGYPVLVFLAMLLIAIVLLNRTRFGRYVYAIGGNEKASFYSGINVDRVKLSTYALLGFCCAVAGLITASRLNSISSGGTGVAMELNAIAAVAIGGTSMRGGSGTLLGTLVGVLLLGVIGNMLNMLNVSSHVQGIVTGIIIITAVLLQRGSGAK